MTDDVPPSARHWPMYTTATTTFPGDSFGAGPPGLGAWGGAPAAAPDAPDDASAVAAVTGRARGRSMPDVQRPLPATDGGQGVHRQQPRSSLPAMPTVVPARTGSTKPWPPRRASTPLPPSTRSPRSPRPLLSPPGAAAAMDAADLSMASGPGHDGDIGTRPWPQELWPLQSTGPAPPALQQPFRMADFPHIKHELAAPAPAQFPSSSGTCAINGTPFEGPDIVTVAARSPVDQPSRSHACVRASCCRSMHDRTY